MRCYLTGLSRCVKPVTSSLQLCSTCIQGLPTLSKRGRGGYDASAKGDNRTAGRSAKYFAHPFGHDPITGSNLERRGQGPGRWVDNWAIIWRKRYLKGCILYRAPYEVGGTFVFAASLLKREGTGR